MNYFPKLKKACEYNWGSPIQTHPHLARGDFDVIICSDLLYDPAGWEPLLESLRLLTATTTGRRQHQRHEAGGQTSTSSAVVYLAQRTRNVQEREFFAKLLETEGSGADKRADAGGRDSSSSITTQEGFEGEEEDDKREIVSFRCRELLEGGSEEEEEWIDGRSQKVEAEGAEVDVSSTVRNCSAGIGGGGLMWRRGCFPDIALYELSPVRAATSGAY